MEKNYDHNSSEDKIYAAWEKAGVMTADAKSQKKPYTITIPPPNVTGQLHLGHAAMLAIEDILIRHKKMTGHEALWVPGTDHAAIATENVVLKHLGLKSREQMSREEFLSECRKFAGEKHDRITHQIKKMGAHLDWSREAYTFDSERNFAVNWIFKKLYEDGLIVRGHRMVNWSVGAQSVLADDEVEWDDNETDFYEFWCGPFIIGTVRTETKCADSPLVVHPEAEYVRAYNAEGRECIVTKKYFDGHTQLRKDFDIKEVVKGEELVGMEFEAETYAGKRKFWVIADEIIDPEFGTGSMTISASHSPEDFDLAQRLNLPLITKIDFEGNMTSVAGPCEGMPVAAARAMAGQIMEETGLLFEKRPHSNRVPKCYRSGTVVEPMLSPQWFISVEKEFTDEFTGEKTTLKKQMQEAVRGGHIKIVPKRFEKVYFQWIDNLRDWCISRQIWWGHQIPVWYDEHENIYLQEEKTILFARHGESEANAKKIIGGNYPLTDKGLQTAHEIAASAKDMGIKKIICSDRKRAQQTAEIVAAELGIPFEAWPELEEFTSSELADKVDLHREGPFEIELDSTKDEDLIDISRRAQDAMERLKKEDDVLVIGHNNFTAALFHFSRSEDEQKFVNFRRGWEWERGELRELKVLADPKGKNLTRDNDTLDTWFSSALWPFSTLGWPDKTLDFEKFYPTDVLETGHDILFFWVARMIMFGRYATGKYPFHTVYLHGLVCDENGQKMSKSKGNGIDPLEVIEEVGADAVRLSLVIGATAGNPIPLGKSKVMGYRNFVNKMWNAGRFVQMQLEETKDVKPNLKPVSLSEKWLLHRLAEVSTSVSRKLEKYEISAAGDEIYHFVWDEFCSWFLESQKVDKNPEFLYGAFLEILKLAHPLVPFITEKLWSELGPKGEFLIDQDFPVLKFKDKDAASVFGTMQEMVTEIRKVRADKKLNPKDKIAVSISAGKEAKKISEAVDVMKALANLSEVTVAAKVEKSERSVTVLVDGMEIYIEVPFDAEAEKARLDKEIAALEKSIGGLKGRLSNKAYTDKAPEHLVAQTRQQLADSEAELEKLQEELKKI